jgi:Protein of unknown function (DUF2911)
VIVLTAVALVMTGVPAETLAADTSCIVMDAPVTERLSPLDSLSFRLDGQTVKVCYGRPSSRGRTMIGGRDVPYDRLWRTGANEPTMVHTTGPISIAGIEVEPGSYSLYTVPGEAEWTIIVNSSITQWGHISEYTYKVRRQEVGRATVPRERTARHVEILTFTVDPVESEAIVFLEWERTRVAIPIVLLGTNPTGGGWRR